MSVDTSTLAAVGRRAGLCAVGFCRAEPFTDTADALQERKQAGLHGGMQFTYRNPDRSTDPARLVPGAAALVVGALEFGATYGDRPDDGRPYARVAAYARADYYTPLRAALEAVAEALRAEGHRAVVSADENGLVDRAAAHRAGIGWWGKNSNILLPGLGSLVVLGAVVTDAPLVPADPEPAADGCGSCRRCLDGCPTGAIVAPGTVDARRCLAWLVQADGVFDPEYRIALGDRIYGCDDCSEVCPPNRASVRLESRANRKTNGPAAWVPVLDVLDASDEDLIATFGRWYIPRRQPRYLRRNALVVLANVGEPSEPRVRAAVDRALGDLDPLIRAHAVWCARRLGLSLDALSDPGDPLVRAELERPVPPRVES
ncbi:MAG: tRNA epoxyqueuosine(34) reductase QueG [Acidimicrobiaceae bacterium]|nr:tRNA epoxyqueuosine(34) reductase QueG [Acidimicrobiaceae bacterium]MDE0517108.1 tRNA epoxyqueuosine(34) reductase QueG [Acidimicrobiaceae bacterium]MXZ95518.1 tRNA epoxyqueuosine(34) reductase QueG [Acidimicrobiaceae bacterium]MYF42816.1 tRNA epoxyqueuosine(34) reductase QueG [Acidimicrobiaceae bacterium]